MNALIVYLVVGLAVGLVTPLVAGRQAMGWVGTCLIGAIGAFTGGVIGSVSVPDDQFLVVRLTAMLCAAVGAVATLALVMIVRDRAQTPRFPRSLGQKAKRWNDGLLASDHRSFETISKQHQRMP